jgi:hypothetical protein
VTARLPREPVCGKGTMHGQAAMESPYGFSACILAPGHTGRCDSGPAPTKKTP